MLAFARHHKHALTLCQILERYIVELFDLLHDQLLLVDLDYDRGVPSISAGEPELAQRGLEFLRYVNSSRLVYKSLIFVKTSAQVYRN